MKYDIHKNAQIYRMNNITQPYHHAKRWACCVIASLSVWLGISFGGVAQASTSFITTASYYTYSSCIKEGTSGIMANGERLDDTKKTCASWDIEFGQRVRITNQRNGRSVICVCTDRGPNKKLYKRGRKIDLSRASFLALGESLETGIVTIMVEVIK